MDSLSKDKKYGVQRKTLKALGDLKNVLESRNVIDQLKTLAENDLLATMNQILDLPEDHANWEHNIAVLVGEARVHRSYMELYTIKEK